MRKAEIRCDNCGAYRPPPPEFPKTWWEIHDSGEVQRVGVMDFCSLPCLIAWATCDGVKRIFSLDFLAPAGTIDQPETPERWNVVRLFRRVALWKWVAHIMIARVK